MANHEVEVFDSKRMEVAKMSIAAPGVVRVSDLHNMVTPRSAPEPKQDVEAAAEDEAEFAEEQVPEFRNRNKTDAEVWEDMLAKYPTLASAAEKFNNALGCIGTAGRQREPLHANRRDYSILLEK